MRVLLPTVLLAGLCMAVPATADEQYGKCIDESDGTNPAWGACGSDWIARADKALNAAWKELRGAVEGNSLNALLDEQRLWNEYKEKSCLFYSGGDFGREGQVLSYPACRAGVIEARTADLESYLKDIRGPN